MTVDDRTRLNLHRKLEAVLGQEEADTLMAHLPPVTWNDIATKDGVASSSALLRSDLEAMRTELRGEMHTMRTELRTEMHTMRTELRGEMHTMEQSIRTDMQVGFAGLRADFVDATNRQIKWLVAFAAGWTSLLVTLVRIVG